MSRGTKQQFKQFSIDNLQDACLALGSLISALLIHYEKYKEYSDEAESLLEKSDAEYIAAKEYDDIKDKLLYRQHEILKLTADHQSSSFSYKDLRKLLEKKGYISTPLSDKNVEILNELLDVRNWTFHNPQSLMVAAKEAAERMVKELCHRHYILRTAWLYGDGKNFAKTMLRIAENNSKVRVVCDQIGTPTSTLELTKGIDSLLFSDNYGLFHATCEGQCSWADFAKEVFRLAGKDMEVEYVTTAQYLADYPQQAARPANSVLENYMFKMTNGYMFASWEDAIKEYMKTLV